MIRYLTASVIAAAALTACTSNDNPATPTTSGTGAASTASASVGTPTPYDETTRTPLDKLKEKLAETVTAQGGDEDANSCVVDEIWKAYEAGDLGPEDLDSYARLGAVTGPMTSFLQELQADGTCTPG